LIKKLVTIPLILALLMASACKPPSGGTGSGPPVPGTKVGGGDWHYRVHLTVLDIESQPARPSRVVTCTVNGYSAGRVVDIVDDQGRRTKYTITVRFDDMRNGTGNLNITNYHGVEVIRYVCTLVGRVGDSLGCEAVTRSGRIAPLLGRPEPVDFAMIESRGQRAVCSGSISVIS
jgi:hypothetical protein